MWEGGAEGWTKEEGMREKQSVNQSIKESKNQRIKESKNQSVNQKIIESFNLNSFIQKIH